MKTVFGPLLIVAALGSGAALVSTQQAHATPVAYPNPGTPNPAVYSFTAATTGDVIGYFAGTNGAVYDTQVGLLVNGVSTGVIGLDDHASTIGQSLDLGHANAGDTLTFVLQNNTLAKSVYSDPSLNLAYDAAGAGSHQHVYSTMLTSAPGSAIPSGVYVGFEDEQLPVSDYNYTDTSFVFTNVTDPPAVATPEPGSVALLATGLIALACLRSRRRATP